MNKLKIVARPKILHVILTLAVGGAEQLVYRMVTSSPVDERPIVCCLSCLGELGELLRQEGGKVYCRNHRGGIDLGIVNWLCQILTEESINVIHAHTYTPYFYSILASIKFRNVKVIYTEHGRLLPEQFNWKKFLLNPLLAKATDHIVSISKSTAKAMNVYDNFPLHRIEVIHNGIHFPESHQSIDISSKKHSLGLPSLSRVIGTAARLEDIKNISMIIRSFREVIDEIPDTYLLIAGKGSEKEALTKLSEDLGLSQRVLFIGLRTDLWEIYQLLEVFLLSSLTEGVSLTLLEAMASGVPAIVTDVGGNPEVVTDGVTGALVPLNDDKAMAKKIIELLNNQRKWNSYASNAKKRITSDFSFESMMESYKKLYQQ